MELFVRKAEASDYHQVKDILSQVQKMHVLWRPDIYKPVQCVMSEDAYLSLVENDLAFVADFGGRAVGFMEIMYRHVENPIQCTRDVLYIDTMAVDEQFRGMGIGHQFFETAKQIKKDKQLDGIELQVNGKNNAAREMYEKCGFTVKTYFMELLDND